MAIDMEFKVIVSDDANTNTEVLAAYLYYELQLDGLGVRFLAALRDCYKK